MKIALVNPNLHASTDSPPIGLVVLAAVLERDGFEVQVVDFAAGDKVDKLNHFAPDAVGITGTTQMVNYAYRIADECRKNGIFTVVGGVHASLFPQEALQHADCVVTGEGERVISDVFKHRYRGVRIGKPLVNLDDAPMPAYHLLNMDYYTSLLSRVQMSFAMIGPPTSKLGTMLTSRGCQMNCLFCYNSYRTLPFRFNSTKRVMEEMKLLCDTYHIDALFFVEDNFFANRKRLLEVCDCMKREHIDLAWGGNSRVNNIDQKVLSAARDVGCNQVTFGWESGSQHILDILKKHTTVEQNIASVKLCNENNINASGTVMLGNPTETDADIAETAQFISTNDITGGIGVCLTTPYPGTGLWRWCEMRGLLPRQVDFSVFDFHHVPVNMSAVSSVRLQGWFNTLYQIVMQKFRESKVERERRWRL